MRSKQDNTYSYYSVKYSKFDFNYVTLKQNLSIIEGRYASAISNKNIKIFPEDLINKGYWEVTPYHFTRFCVDYYDVVDWIYKNIKNYCFHKPPVDFYNAIKLSSNAGRINRAQVKPIYLSKIPAKKSKLSVVGRDYNSHMDDIVATYHNSVPVVRMHYPDSFLIASTYMHNDLWYAYIANYNYWIWGMFSPVIIFFSIKGEELVRWCRVHVKPMRETRGASRSKCADLITAIIPVMWAITIIINESTDAIDFFDGFGTTEITLGIRAYQWGWEYYYPKDQDLSFRLKPSNSSFQGKSLKYNNAEPEGIKMKNFWKFYQMKFQDSSVMPAHVSILQSNDLFFNNFLKLKDVGYSLKFNSDAFRKVRMFSKFYNYNLYNINFYIKKPRIAFSYTSNDLNLYNFSLYSIKRQTTFLTCNNFLSGSSTFLDTNSLNTYLDYNLTHVNRLSENSLISFFYNFNFKSKNSSFFSKKLEFLDLFNLSNLNFNKKNNSYVINNIFLKKNKLNLFKLNNTLNLEVYNDKSSDLFIKKRGAVSYDSLNLTGEKGGKNYYTDNERFLKNFSKKNILKLDKTFKTGGLVSDLGFIFNKKNLPFYDLNGVKRFSNIRGLNSKLVYNIMSNNLYINLNSSPLNSPYHSQNMKNYDYFDKNEASHPIFSEKEKAYPQPLINTYWNILLESNSPSTRLYKNINNGLHFSKFYGPIYGKCEDYFSKNSQLIKYFEDIFWDDYITSYIFEEYVDFYKYAKKPLPYLRKSSIRYFMYDLNFKDFNNFDLECLSKDCIEGNRELRLKNLIRPSFLEDLNTGNMYSASISFEDSSNEIKLTPYRYFFYYQISSQNLNSLEESYEFYKNLNQSAFRLFNRNFSILNMNTLTPKVYSSYIDNFRTYTDSMFWSDEGYIDGYYGNTNLNFIKNFNFSEPLNRRHTSREAYVYYNAFQKVFKSRLDEGRSNSKLLTFAQTYDKNPYLTAKSAKYSNMLLKNKNHYVSNLHYRDNFLKNFNDFYFLDTSLNFYIYDFPFLLSNMNDTSRHLWFDWYSRWSFVKVEPSNQSKYDLYGAPFINKLFEADKLDSDYVTDNENYFSKLSKARELYFQNWATSPYTYYKNINWYSDFLKINDFDNISDDWDVFFEFINKFNNSFFIKNPKNLNKSGSYFINSRSNLFNKGSSFWKPFNNLESYIYSITQLIDILNKREYIFREYSYSKLGSINVPSSYVTSPENPIILDFKSSYNFLNFNSNNSEFSKDVYFNFLNLYDNYLNKNLNLNIKNDLNFSDNSLKSQYKPMKKGPTNMIRLHATGAVAIPIETRIQMMSSSKDVIHSWAVPSAGVKIDCVPGYSSHRVMIFLLSGIFWGQCMEICGRYHHWMPLIVYFMKKDLYFLWAYHFVFMSNKNLNLSMCNNQDIALGSRVSFDRSGWLGLSQQYKKENW